MTTQNLKIQLERRALIGKKVRFLRRQNITPVHMYGVGIEPLNLQGDSAELQKIVRQAGGNLPITITVSGEETPYFVFVREIQRHPVTEGILHIDLYQVITTKRMQATVPIRLTGEAPAVRVLSGVLFQAIHFFTVDCLPLDVPQVTELNISHLDDFEKTLCISDIKLSDRVTIINEPQQVIAKVNAPRVATSTTDGTTGVPGSPEEGTSGS
jgi:large subunit ribosomal protein L25